MSQNEYAIALGLWIRDQRVALGMTQPELADAVGVSQSTISGWENASTTISSWSHVRLKSVFREKAKEKGVTA